MNVIFSNELQRRLSGTSVTSNSVHPGFVNSEWGRDAPGWMFRMQEIGRKFSSLSCQDGAKTSLYAATSPELEGIGGIYLTPRGIVTPAKSTLNEEIGKGLWEVSEEIVGLNRNI